MFLENVKEQQGRFVMLPQEGSGAVTSTNQKVAVLD